ncbi:MAG: hypothetical protein LUE29_00710 [Lachnospiraceae bacterium]|nr:hypothetical protein [Lachnospiraceae bacterium]
MIRKCRRGHETSPAFNHVRGCEEYGGPLPKYEFSGGVMVLCNACDLYLQLMNKNNGEMSTFTEDPINDWKFDENADIQSKLLAVIRLHLEWTRKKYSEALEVSDATIKRILSKLQKENIVVHEESRKKGKWIIVKK